MNKIYLIVPILLLGAFCFYYHQFSAEQAVIDARKAQDARDAAAQVEQNKLEAMKKATADAQAREEAQHAEEARQQAEHLANFEASKQKLADETAKFQQEADSYAKQAADLQTQLDSLHSNHEQLSRNVFELQKQVELAKIDRRNADIEVERTYDIVTQKITASPLTYVPPPPTPAVR